MEFNVAFAETGRQTSGTSDQVPRSGPDLQPRVAVPATLGDEFQTASTPLGLRHLPFAYTQRSRRAATLGWRSLPLLRYAFPSLRRCFISETDSDKLQK